MRKTRVRRRPIADINVVPYIDVMLVLLIIFMVTAPLITQGVNVELPQAEAEVISGETTDPVVITVDQFGDYYLDLGEERNLPVDAVTLEGKLRTVLRLNPKL
ncbi:MAG TPA: biopolymer transporter ExbD, partial [Chromatiaceae bacterium]|nr:biopolymer transporter ExbD [Chromatiaceae bacterium]